MAKSRLPAHLLKGATALLGVAGLLYLLRLLPLGAWITSVQGKIEALGPWGAVLFPFLFGSCNLVLFPGGSVVAISGGLFFGLIGGALLILLGNVMAAAAAVFIGRKIGRRWIEKKMLTQPRWRRLDTAIERDGWKIIFLTQIHPFFPTSLLNYFYGVTSIRFWPCVLWIAIGQIPSSLFFAYLGTLTQKGLDVMQGKGETASTTDYALTGVGFVVAVLLFVAVGRIALKLLKETEGEETPLPVPLESDFLTAESSVLPLGESTRAE